MTRWFRYYEEALTDPKVQCLDGEVFKTWVNLLCIASKMGGKLPVIHELSYLLSSRSDKITRHINELFRRGLLDLVDDQFEPHNWLSRQYKSDSSTDRVKKHREAKCNVSSTVSVTRPETENRIQIQKEDTLSEPSSDAPKRKRLDYPQDFEKFWTAYPTDALMSKKQAFDAWKRLSPEDRAKAHSAAPSFAQHCRKNPDYRPLHACRFLSQRRFDGFAETPTEPPAEQIDFMRSKGYEWTEGKWQKLN